jgi:hypothetical protein
VRPIAAGTHIGMVLARVASVFDRPVCGLRHLWRVNCAYDQPFSGEVRRYSRGVNQ